jgi:hypothetical protein
VIGQCKHTLLFCSSREEWGASLAFLGCGWDRGWVFIFGFYSWGFSHETLWLCTFLQFSVINISLQSFIMPFPFFPSLSHTCHSGFCKVSHFLMILFSLHWFFCSGKDFYCVKMISSLQLYLFKWNIFT